MDTPRLISIRKNPEFTVEAITYIQSRWPEVPGVVYEDCISHCAGARNPLPQWYLLQREGQIMGCCGLITNDFISRMDLYPWICALYIEPEHRGHGYSSLLIERSKQDCSQNGFASVYLATDLIGYYERYGFQYVGKGYHPQGGESRIYECEVKLRASDLAYMSW